MRPLCSPLLILLTLICWLSPASASLIEYDSFIHDTDLNLYWTKDGNLYGEKMTWQGANEWINTLNNYKYGGFSNWRLPNTPDGTWGYNPNTISTRYNVTTSELGHLFYSSLGLKGKEAPDGTINQTYGLGTTTTPFDNLQSGYYWFGTISDKFKLSGKDAVWKFDFQHGSHFLDTIETNKAYAIAVRDATPAPEPSTALLFLAGLVGICRARRHHSR